MGTTNSYVLGFATSFASPTNTKKLDKLKILKGLRKLLDPIIRIARSHSNHQAIQKKYLYVDYSQAYY